MIAASALAAIVVIAVVSPALGGPSLKKLIKREVAKQISKANGPAGANGADGAAGTARAYGSVLNAGSTPCTPNCQLTGSKGITSVIYTGNGVYCIVATGISSAGDHSPLIASVNWNHTTGPEGNASAMGLEAHGGICPVGNFGVRTQRIPVSATPSAANANDVGFDFIIP